MITRRKAISLIAGLATVAMLGTYRLSMRNSTGLQSRSVRDVLTAAGRTGLPDRYLEFLEWLSEVSKRVGEGKEPTIALMAETTALATQKIERDFYLATGINSKLDISPYPIHVSKTLSSLGIGASIYDAVAVESFDITLYSQFFKPITDVMEEFRDYTYDRFSLRDFNPEALNLVGTYPPREVGDTVDRGVMLLPFSSPTMIHFYRRDVYDQRGMSPPKNWDEYIEDLKELNRPEEGVFATAMHVGSDVGIVTEVNNFVYSFGGRLFELVDGMIRPTMDSDEVVEALRVYAAIRPYADPASISYDWDTVATAMRRGRIIHAILWQDFAWMMDDPARSTVVNKVDYKMNPAGPEGAFHQFVGDGVGLVKNSRNLLAAWLWLQWATEVGTRIMLTLDEKAKVVPIRLSLLTDPEIQFALNRSEFNSVKVVKEVLDSRQVAYIPPLPRASQVLFTMGRYLRSAWGGKDPRQALKEMKHEIESLGPLMY